MCNECNEEARCVRQTVQTSRMFWEGGNQNTIVVTVSMQAQGGLNAPATMDYAHRIKIAVNMLTSMNIINFLRSQRRVFNLNGLL